MITTHQSKINYYWNLIQRPVIIKTQYHLFSFYLKYTAGYKFIDILHLFKNVSSKQGNI